MRLFLIILLLPIKLFSQDLEGVWTGTLYNDTTKKNIPYEIAITDSKGKISGYSHIVFMDNDKEVTGVKTLKIKKKNGKILIEDDELIYNNYIEPPAKGIKKYCVLTFTSGASGEYLIGAFNTNRTKEYASATGTINLKKKEKITETKIIPKLDELKLSNALSFLQPKPAEKKEVAILPPTAKENKVFSQPAQPQKDVALNLPKTKKEPVRIEKDENLIDINEDTIDYKVDVIDTDDIAKNKKQKTEDKKSSVAEKKIVTVPLQAKQTVVPPETNKPVTEKKTDHLRLPPKQTVVLAETKKLPVQQPNKEVAIVPVKEEKKTPLPQPKEKIPTAVVTKPDNKPQSTLPSNAKENIRQTVAINSDTITKEKTKAAVITQIVKPVQNSTMAGPVISAEELAMRKIETIRSVDIKSDSITLTLYDNGVVDGDTVSIILNGKTIMSKQRLTTTALTKTVYITADLGDSLQLIMYAENLGSIAPNTGLLIIKDGEESYQIRFSGDLQKNSAIILRRKVTSH